MNGGISKFLCNCEETGSMLVWIEEASFLLESCLGVWCGMIAAVC